MPSPANGCPIALTLAASVAWALMQPAACGEDAPRPGDPEFVRGFPGETEPAPQPTKKEDAPEPAPPEEPAVKPGDPEFGRDFPPIDDPIPPAPKAQQEPRPREIQRGDPEFERQWPEGRDLTLGPLAETEPEPAPRAEPKGEQQPRFVIGEGLDDPSAQLGREFYDPLAEAARLAAEKKAREAVEAEAHAKKGEKPVDREVALKRLLKEAQEQQKELAKERKEGRKKDNAAQEDPEKKLQGLLARIRQEQEKLAAARKLVEAPAESRKAGEQAAAEAEEVLRTHSREAKDVMEALYSRPPARVGGRVLDAATGAQIPARILLIDASKTAAGSQVPGKGFWSDGAFESLVVSGKVRVEIHAGRFRRMHYQEVMAQPEQPGLVEAALLAPEPLAFGRNGWVAADLNRPLLARPGEEPLWIGDPPSLIDAVRAARAEGVQVLGIAQPWPELYRRLPEERMRQLFEAAREQGVLLLPVTSGPRHAFNGCVLGIGMARWRGLPERLADPRLPLQDPLDEIRATGGVAVWTELRGRRNVDPREHILPFFPRLKRDGFLGGEEASARLYGPAELPYNTVIGPTYDALAFDGSEFVQRLWFELLNEGYAIPIVGAGGPSLEAGGLPEPQTFLKIDGAPSVEKVLEACRAGRSFVSFGPAVFVRIMERDKFPGDRLAADGSTWKLEIAAWSSLQRGTSLESYEIVRNGVVVHREKLEDGMAEKIVRVPLRERQDAWYVVRVTEKAETAGEVFERRVALSNPIYFDTAGRRLPQPAKARMIGTLRRPGGTPLAGKVTIVEPGAGPREVEIAADGRFNVGFLAAGALVFEADGYEPLSRRPYQNPATQPALGRIFSERDGTLEEQLTTGLTRTLGHWRLLLADWHEDVELTPIRLPEVPKEIIGDEEPPVEAAEPAEAP